MFGDIFSMLSQQGPDAWYTTASQLALNIARGEDGDPNPLPIERQRLEELAPLVGRHVDALFGVASDPVVTAVNRSSLTIAALAQWRLLVVNNLASFAQAWSLEHDEVYVFALAQEFVASLVLSQPGTGDALRALLLDGVLESAAAQGDLLERLQSMINPEDLSSLMSNPESLLDGIEMPDETAATRAINAATSVLLAFFDAAAHEITTAILGPRPALVEAYRRHRRSDARGEDAAAALFGIATQGPHHDAAHEFVATLEAQHSLSVFDALLRVDGLPSANELSDPAAWYERVTNSPLA